MYIFQIGMLNKAEFLLIWVFVFLKIDFQVVVYVEDKAHIAGF